MTKLSFPLDVHYLIREFLSWDELFLSKQVSKGWSKQRVKHCFRPTTLHGMPAWVLMYAWIFSHIKEATDHWTISEYTKQDKRIWGQCLYGKIQSCINKLYFAQLFNNTKSLDITQMSRKSQVFLLRSAFIGNLALESLKVNYWLIQYHRDHPMRWFSTVKKPVHKLIIVTELPYQELWDHHIGGSCKEVEIICMASVGPAPRKSVLRIDHYERVIAPMYEFTLPVTTVLQSWYKTSKLLYYEDINGIYQRKNKTEPFTFVPRLVQQQQPQQIITKRQSDSCNDSVESNKKQKV
jgi:hypothetical protein